MFFTDGLPDVEFWVRNLERQPIYSFWLQTSNDRFYPDFIAKLKNGKILVVEYKGEGITRRFSLPSLALRADQGLPSRLAMSTALRQI
jgi:hypothetical protein